MKEELGNSGTLSTVEMLEIHRCLTFNRLTELITPTIQNIVEFAKKIPGQGEDKNGEKPDPFVAVLQLLHFISH